MTADSPGDGIGNGIGNGNGNGNGPTMVAITQVDNAGITRVKGVPTGRLDHVARYGVGMSPCFETFTFDDRMVIGRHLGGPDGDLRLVPDLARLTALAGSPGWAWAPAMKFGQDGEPFAPCQRLFATRQVEAAERAGLRLRMAFETEWSLGADAEEFVPVVRGPGYGIVRLGDVEGYALDLVDALQRQGLAVEQFHPEYALSQVELSVAPNDPVGAADDAVLVRHTIRRLSSAHGWRATFAPSVDPDGAGSGAHLHFSVLDDETSVFADGPGPYGLQPAGEAFLAGVLAEMPALVAVGAGNPASFLRLRPSRWAGVWQAWGREAREAALRFVTGMRGTASWAANAEVKCFDATGNPYLVAGAVIAAGLAGVARDLRLPAEISGDPATLTDGAPPRLPTSPAEAADRLEGSEVLAAAMGPELHDAIVTVRRAEADGYADATPQEIVDAVRWRF
ncbi:glutamine synthetase family protein [Actinomycetes bacterium KLBMP 9759]